MVCKGQSGLILFQKYIENVTSCNVLLARSPSVPRLVSVKLTSSVGSFRLWINFCSSHLQQGKYIFWSNDKILSKDNRTYVRQDYRYYCGIMGLMDDKLISWDRSLRHFITRSINICQHNSFMTMLHLQFYIIQWVMNYMGELYVSYVQPLSLYVDEKHDTDTAGFIV